MLTTEKLDTFVEDYKEFNDTCNHLAEILFLLDSDYEVIDHWYIVKNCEKWEVHGVGGYVSWGEWTECTVSFPSEFLSATDEEVQKYVDDQLEKRKQAKILEEEKRKKEIEKKKENLSNFSKDQLIEMVLNHE